VEDKLLAGGILCRTGSLDCRVRSFSDAFEKPIFALHLSSLLNHWCVSPVLGNFRPTNQPARYATSLVAGILRVGYVLDIIDQIKSFPLENWEDDCR
jgi:hypothetical protein